MSWEELGLYDRYKKGATNKEEAFFLAEDIVHEGIDPDDVQKRYDSWPETYDKDMAMLDYEGPKMTARELVSYFYYNKDALILDCAAGTGLNGQEMADHGMTNLHCLDLNANMLKKAMSRGIYKESIVAFLGPNKTEIPDNKYDGLILSGAFYTGHVKPDCLPEMIRVVKPGGFIVLGIREANMVEMADYRDLEALMQLHEARGLWKRMMRKTLPNYYDTNSGVIWCHQVC